MSYSVRKPGYVNIQRAWLTGLCMPWRRTVMSSKASRQPLPDGIYTTMITPFLNDDKTSIDWNGIDFLTEWYIKSGMSGIFSVCLSSEMFQLSNEERIAIARRVKEKAAGRVPVLVGATFEGGLEEQARLMNIMGEFADSVVIITNQIATMEESDEVWLANCQKLMDLTGNISLGLYETPVPKARHLTPAMVRWVAETGRFTFLKDTSLSVSTLLEKIQAAKAVEGTPLKIYTAKTQFINDCINGGGNGFSGVSANFFPWLNVWLYQHRGDSIDRRGKVQRFMSIADRVIANKYPTSSKFYLSKFYGAPIQPISRIQEVTFNDQDTKSLEDMKTEMEELCQGFNITIVDPVTKNIMNTH